MPAKRKSTSPKDSTANPGFEVKHWLAADTFRNVQPPTSPPIWSPPMTSAAALNPIES